MKLNKFNPKYSQLLEVSSLSKSQVKESLVRKTQQEIRNVSKNHLLQYPPFPPLGADVICKQPIINTNNRRKILNKTIVKVRGFSWVWSNTILSFWDLSKRRNSIMHDTWRWPSLSDSPHRPLPRPPPLS